MTRVLVFGTFDGLHAGHLSYLTQAHALGDIVIASVPDDATVVSLKRRLPKQSFEERKAALIASGLVQEIFMSDLQQGSYQIFHQVQPDIILLGYDQEELRHDLEKHHLSIPIHHASSFQPDVYKSRILNQL